MRAAVFIDGGYFLNQAKNARVFLDYPRLAEHLMAPLRANLPTDLLRCYFYYCAPWVSPEPTEDEKRRMEAHNEFMAMAEGISRWQMRLGKLERRWDGNKEYFEQKRVDVLLSCDLVRHTAAGHIQHAIIVAGDSDFIPAVASAKESGATVSLWCGPPNTVHKDLVAMADEVHQLNWGRIPRVPPPAHLAAGASSPPAASTAQPASSSARAATETTSRGQSSRPGSPQARREVPVVVRGDSRNSPARDSSPVTSSAAVDEDAASAEGETVKKRSRRRGSRGGRGRGRAKKAAE